MIFRNLFGSAFASFFAAETAAGTIVHCGEESEIAGEACGRFCAADIDEPVFERLSQGFQDVAREFCYFVHEQDSFVGESYLARF